MPSSNLPANASRLSTRLGIARASSSTRPSRPASTPARDVRAGLNGRDVIILGATASRDGWIVAKQRDATGNVDAPETLAILPPTPTASQRARRPVCALQAGDPATRGSLRSARLGRAVRLQRARFVQREHPVVVAVRVPEQGRRGDHPREGLPRAATMSQHLIPWRWRRPDDLPRSHALWHLHGTVPPSRRESDARLRAEPGADPVVGPPRLRRGLDRRAPQRWLGDDRLA